MEIKIYTEIDDDENILYTARITVVFEDIDYKLQSKSVKNLIKEINELILENFA
jgi:hypothetical protein